MIKVTTLANPKGLMVIVPLEEWAEGMRALIKMAKKRGIIPGCINCQKLDENSEEPTQAIILWGDK